MLYGLKKCILFIVFYLFLDLLTFRKHLFTACAYPSHNAVTDHLSFLRLLCIGMQWRTERGVWGVQPPPPRNSEGHPKSCQTQSNCENC